VYLDSDFNCQEARIYIKNCVPRGAILGSDFIKLGTQFMPLMALGFNNNLGNQGANFNCRPSNIVVNCISIYIMVILDNSRTLGAFERQSRILHI
jgi:hypothetical protein